MGKENDYSINELFKEILEDDSWENDYEKRKSYVAGLRFELKDLN